MERTMADVEGERTLRFERELPHPPERVSAAISDPAEIARWMGADAAGATPGMPEA
jgi:uncharacterized protein YndB with AHSA1/START domain